MYFSKSIFHVVVTTYSVLMTAGHPIPSMRAIWISVGWYYLKCHSRRVIPSHMSTHWTPQGQHIAKHLTDEQQAVY